MSQPIRILVVENDPVALEFLSTILRAQGFEVREATTACKGLQLLHEQPPDLVLLNVTLPDLTGPEVCRQIKTDATLQDVFVVLISGRTDGAAQNVEDQACGADDYLIRPLDPAEFLARIRTMLRLRQVSAALRASEQHYRQLIEILPEAAGLVDSQGRVLSANPQALALLACAKPAELLQRSLFDFIPPEDHERVRSKLNCLLESGFIRNEECTLLAKGGSRLPVQFSAALLKNSQGQTRGFVGVVRDITERQQSEQVVRQSEQRYRELAENIREVFWISDPAKNQIHYVSPAYEEIWGRSCRSLYASPRDWIEAIHPEDRERVLAAALTKQTSGEYDEVYRIVRPDGSLRWIQDRAFAVRDQSGTVCRVVGVAADITRQKLAEQSLHESEDRYRELAESLPDATFVLDRDTVVRYANRAAAEWLHLPPAELLGRSPTDLFPPETGGRYKEIICRVFETGEPERAEEWFSLAVGSKWLEVRLVPLRDENGNVKSVLGLARDLTGRKQIEEELRRLHDAVQSTDELISITDHENRFTFVNRAFLEAYGYEREEVLGKTPDFLQSPKNPLDRSAWIFQATQEGGWRGQNLNRRKDGTEFPIFLSTACIKDDAGDTLGFVGVARDISARIQAEKQSAAFSLLGHRLSAADDAEAAAKIILEIASELFGWDAGYVHLYSADKDEIIPLLTVDTVDGQRTVVPPTSFTLDPSPLMRKVLAEGAGLTNRKTHDSLGVPYVPFGDKDRCSASLMHVPIRLGGETIGILSIQSYAPNAYSPADLNLLQTLADHCGEALHRINVAGALREAESRYRNIFENAVDGIFQITPEGRFLSANPALARMYGYDSPAELMSSVTDIVRETYVETARQLELARVLESQGFVQGFETERFRRDGRKIWVTTNVRAVRDEAGRLLYYEGSDQDITKRKHAEEALRQSEERLNLAQQAAHISTFDWDIVANKTMWSQEAEVLYGLSPGSFREQPIERWHEFLHPEDRERVLAVVKESLARRTEAKSEFRITRPDGTVRWIAGFWKLTCDERGQPSRLVGVNMDITERKKAESVLRESEEKFRALFESAPIGIALQDASGRVIETNRRYEQITGYLVDDLRRLGVPRLIHPEDIAEGQRLHAELCDGRRDRYQREERYLSKDGSVIWGQSSVSAIRNASGELIHIISMIEDISGRKRMLEALRESEGNLRLIAENTTDVIFAFDMERRPLYINPAVELLTGHTAREIHEKRFINWIHPADQARMLRHWEELYIGKAYQDVEFRLVTKSGQVKWCSSTWGPLLDETGRQVGIQGRERDITQRRDLEQQILETSVNERRRIGHDLHDGLGQWLAGIALKAKAMEVGLIEERSAQATTAAELIALLNNAIGQTRQLAQGLDPVHVEADGLVAALKKLAAQSSALFGIHCTFACTQPRLPVTAQVGLALYRIAQEAINNAFRHGQARRIQLELEVDGLHLCLRIRDEGEGFDPNSDHRGGMGLRIMRYRANSIQAALTIHSRPGAGAQIECRVPNQPGPGPAAGREPTPGDSQPDHDQGRA